MVKRLHHRKTVLLDRNSTFSEFLWEIEELIVIHIDV